MAFQFVFAGTEARGAAFGGFVPTTRPGWLKLSESLREQMLPIVVVGGVPGSWGAEAVELAPRYLDLSFTLLMDRNRGFWHVRAQGGFPWFFVRWAFGY